MSDRDVAREERAIYLVIAVVTIPVVVAAIISNAVIDTGATLCLGLAAFSLINVFGRGPRVLPRAQATLRARRTTREAPRVTGSSGSFE